MKSFLVAFFVLALAMETTFGLSCYTCMHIEGSSTSKNRENETELYKSCDLGDNDNSTNVQECTNENQVCGSFYFNYIYWLRDLTIAWRGCIDSRIPGTPELNSCDEWDIDLYPATAFEMHYKNCNCDTARCNSK